MTTTSESRQSLYSPAVTRVGAPACLMTLDGLRSLLDEPFATREVDFMLKTWRGRFGKKGWADA